MISRKACSSFCLSIGGHHIFPNILPEPSMPSPPPQPSGHFAHSGGSSSSSSSKDFSLGLSSQGRVQGTSPQGPQSLLYSMGSSAAHSQPVAAWQSQSHRCGWIQGSQTHPCTECYWASGPGVQPGGQEMSHNNRREENCAWAGLLVQRQVLQRCAATPSRMLATKLPYLHHLLL